MGEVPDFYEIIVTARYFHVPPWEMAGIPETAGCYAWVVWAAIVQSAIASAESQLTKHRQQTGGLRR